ncbi:putative histone-lysine N-methyltransferase 1, partial [Aphis craccivora]
YDEEDDENKLNQPNEKTFVDTEKPESPVSADNQKGAVEPEHLQNENVESNEENNTPADISQGDNSGESKTKRRRKLKDPKDGKEISEEYDEEEDGNKLNQPNEKTFVDTEKTESPVSADNQEGAVEPEHLQNENVESNEENNTPADISEGDNSGESKKKRRRIRKNLKDRKKYPEENDTFEEDDNSLNKLKEKKNTDSSEIEPIVNKENNNEQETEEEDTNTDIRSVNEDTTKENLSKESMSFDENDKKIDQETTTNETEDLDENENLNSVEDAELKCVNNERIIPAAESMGEDSTSYESSYESPEQNRLVTLKKRLDEGNHQPNRRNRRRRDPKTGLDESEEYDTLEEQDEASPLEDNKIDTPENEEHPEYNQSN